MSGDKRGRSEAFSTSSEDSFYTPVKRQNIIVEYSDEPVIPIVSGKMDKTMRQEFLTMFDDMKTSLLQELSAIYDKRLLNLEKENGNLKQEILNQDGRIKKLETEMVETRRHAVHNEQYARRCNIRVLGIPEEDGEVCKTTVYQIIRDKLAHSIQESQIIESHRVGVQRGERPRGIIVRLASLAIKKTVLQKRRALKGSGIVFHEDLCRELQLTLNRLKNDDRVNKSWASDGKIFGTLYKRPDRKFKILYGQSIDDAIAVAGL